MMIRFLRPTTLFRYDPTSPDARGLDTREEDCAEQYLVRGDVLEVEAMRDLGGGLVTLRVADGAEPQTLPLAREAFEIES
jgi:hypothetical protein